MPLSFFAGFGTARFKSAAKRGAACLLAAVPAFTAIAQQPAPMHSAPFTPSRGVAWDGEIMDNLVLRYRRVLRYPEAADRFVWAFNQAMVPLGCTVPASYADALRRQATEFEQVVHLSGTSKRREERGVSLERIGRCSDPVRVLRTHTIDIRTMDRRILYTSRGDQRKVSVTETPSEILPSMRSEAQARLRNARNPRTSIGRSMGRVWTERATFNGLDCGSTVFGVEHSCVLLAQPRHVATNTLISVRTKPFNDDPQCENPAGPEWNNWVFHLGCLTISHRELVSFEKNARIPRDLFEMPPEARGLPVNRRAIPEADEDRERD